MNVKAPSLVATLSAADSWSWEVAQLCDEEIQLGLDLCECVCGGGDRWPTEMQMRGAEDAHLDDTQFPGLNAVLENFPALAMATAMKDTEHRHKYWPSPFTHLTAIVAAPAPTTEMA